MLTHACRPMLQADNTTWEHSAVQEPQVIYQPSTKSLRMWSLPSQIMLSLPFGAKSGFEMCLWYESRIPAPNRAQRSQPNLVSNPDAVIKMFTRRLVWQVPRCRVGAGVVARCGRLL